MSALRQKLAAAARSAAEAVAAGPTQAHPPRDTAERPMDVDCQALAAEPGQRAPKQEAAGAERPLSNGALPTTKGHVTRRTDRRCPRSVVRCKAHCDGGRQTTFLCGRLSVKVCKKYILSATL